MAIANDMTLPDLFRLLGTTGFWPTGGDMQWDALADITGLGADALASMRLPGQSSPGARVVDVGGLSMRIDQLATQTFRFCPACLTSDGVAPMWWSIHLVTCCPAHRHRLLDECPSCRRRLRQEALDAHWRCIGCDALVGDAEPVDADETELALARLVVDDVPGDPERWPAGFLNQDPETRLSIVERLGSIVARSSNLEPLSKRRTVLAMAKVDLAYANRPVTESRAIAAAGVPILADWPGAYRSLLDGLVDRSPYDERQLPRMRRMATEAGHLAMRSLYISGGRAVPFVDDQRDAWLAENFDSKFGRRRIVPIRFGAGLVGEHGRYVVDGIQAYVTATEAMATLGGGSSVDDLAAWIRAELIQVHIVDGGHRIPKTEIDAVVARFATLPRDDGRPNLLPFSEIDRARSRSYSLEDLLIDVASGHIGAFVRWPERTALSSLVFDVSDLQRRQGAMSIAAAASAGEPRIFQRFARHFVAVWGQKANLRPSELAQAAREGRIRRYERPVSNAHYSIADIVAYLQRQPHFERMMRLHGRIVPDYDNLRDLIVLAPRHVGIPELTGIASKWIRF